MCCRIINDITKQIKPSHVVFQVLHLNYCHLCNNMQITQHWCHIWMLLHAASFHCSSSTVVWMLLHAASSHCGSSLLISECCCMQRVPTAALLCWYLNVVACSEFPLWLFSADIWMLLHAASSHCGSSQLLSLSATSYSAEDLPNQRQVLHQHQLVWGKRRKQLQGEWCWNSTSVDFPVLLLVSGMIEREFTDDQSINQRNFYSATYKKWTAALDNVNI